MRWMVAGETNVATARIVSAVRAFAPLDLTAAIAFAAALSIAVSCTETPTQPPPPPPPPAPSFSIDFRFVPGATPTAQQLEQLQAAAERWEKVITGDLPDFQVSEPAAFLCERVTVPPMDELVDDLVVWIDFGPMDGPGGAGAWAAVCLTRSDYLPVVSSILFDEADTFLSATLALHEFAHTLGFGEVWDEMGLLVDATKLTNGGSGGIEASQDATISSFSVDENFGIPGASLLSTNLVAGRNLGDWTGGPDSEELRTLLQFDVSAVQLLYPITRARVVLHATAASVPTAFSEAIFLGPVDEGWAETAVAWSNQPVFGSTESVFAYTSACSPCPPLDATESVQYWLDEALPNHGFYLILGDVANTDAYLGFHSRHSAESDLRPQLFVSPDTHFIGPNAAAQFNAAGGGAYMGPRVPVENDSFRYGESTDGHWRGFLFSGEMMHPRNFTSAKLSSITIGALQDMGYEVDYAQADPFEVTNVP